MPVFLIVSEENNPTLDDKVREMFPEKYYVLSGNQWLVDAEETTSDMSKELEISEGNFGRVTVFKIDGYTGYHKKSLWEWLALD